MVIEGYQDKIPDKYYVIFNGKGTTIGVGEIIDENITVKDKKYHADNEDLYTEFSNGSILNNSEKHFKHYIVLKT